jgi:uncharacterized protein YciW
VPTGQRNESHGRSWRAAAKRIFMGDFFVALSNFRIKLFSPERRTALQTAAAITLGKTRTQRFRRIRF